jgi:hypothetical protein
MTTDATSEHSEAIASAGTEHPSRERFRASRRQQRAERRRRYIAVPLVLIGLAMVGAGVWKFTHNDGPSSEVPAQVNGVEVTNTTTSMTVPDTDVVGVGGTSVDGSAVPVIPPASDPLSGTSSSVATTTAPTVSIIPPATVRRRTTVKKKAATTTTAKPRATTTIAGAGAGAPATTAKG